MNIGSINGKSPSSANDSLSSSKGGISFAKGQLIEGVVSKVSDQISIDFNGKQIKVPRSAVPGAKEGEIRKFEVQDISETSIVLKEVTKDKEQGSSIRGVCTNVETDQTAFQEHLKQVKEADEKKETQEQAEQENKEKLEDITSRLTGEDFEELMKEGNILKAYDVVRLDMALERVKEQRADIEKGIIKQVEIKNLKSEQLEQIGYGNIEDKTGSKMIAEKLIEANLPATEENIQKIQAAMNQANDINELTGNQIQYLIKNDLEPTIENIYKSSYAGNGIAYSPVAENDFKQLQPQVEKIIKEAGFTVDKANIQKARWLIEHNLPLTKENLGKLAEIENINSNIQKQDFSDTILNKIIMQAAAGKKPEKTSLSGQNTERVQKLLSFLQNVTDASVKSAAAKGEVTIESLKKAEEAGPYTKSDSEPSATEQILREITAKRQIEEIRLKLTVESGQKMIQKGIKIETEPLAKLVDELKQLETEYYNKLLKEQNVEVSNENVSMIQELAEKMQALKEMPNQVLGVTFSNRLKETVHTLYDVGTAEKIKLTQANESYETLMTSPRRDLGDSIKKAFDSIEPILKDLGLELTDANKRAVKILGYNHLEITKESIQEMKLYDAQVNHLFKEFHPAAVVQMIKEGKNPINMPISELNEQLDEIKQELGLDEDEKFSHYLYKLDKQNQISDEERSAFIGIYRLINQVEKSDGKAIGMVIKSGQELTMKHLLTAVRSEKAEGFNKKVDGMTNYTVNSSISDKSITAQIQKGFSNSTIQLIQEDQENDTAAGAEEEYYSILLKELSATVDSGKLSAMTEKYSIQEMMDIPLEQFREEMDSQEIDSLLEEQYNKEQVEKIRSIAAESDDAIHFLQNSHLPVTLASIETVKEYQKGNSVFSDLYQQVKKETENKKSLSKAEDILEEGLTDKNNMIAKYDEIDSVVNKIIENIKGKENINYKELTHLEQLQYNMNFISSLARRQSFEIPIFHENGVTNLNVTLVNGVSEKGKIELSMNSVKYGKLEAVFHIKGNEVNGIFICENRETLEAMKAEKEILTGQIEENEFFVSQISYGISHKPDNVYGTKEFEAAEQQTDTKQLYKLAKILVHNVRLTERKDEQNENQS